jgi:hypothetical protein
MGGRGYGARPIVDIDVAVAWDLRTGYFREATNAVQRG